MTDAELFMAMRASFKQSEAFVEAVADSIEAREAEIERLRDALKGAFYEGFLEGREGGWLSGSREAAWKKSDAFAKLK